MKNKGLLAIVVLAAVAIVVVVVVVLARPNLSDIQRITPAQYQQQFASGSASYMLIDVRTPEEFASGHISGAINISVETLPNRLSEVPRDKTIIVYCRSGNRSATASSILSQAGYNPIYDLGGILAWTAAGLPTVQ
jgi:phage shock protein E